MQVDSDRGAKRSAPQSEEMLGMLARLFEEGGDDDDIELGLNMLVLKQRERERVLIQVQSSGEDCPVPEEATFEWDGGDELYCPPQDAVYIDDLSGKELSPELVSTARNEEIDFVDKIKLWTGTATSRDQGDRHEMV